jgi:hypothetical protein
MCHDGTGLRYDRAEARFGGEHYTELLLQSKSFEGVVGLDALEAAGFKLGCITNKVAAPRRGFFAAFTLPRRRPQANGVAGIRARKSRTALSVSGLRLAINSVCRTSSPLILCV